MLRPDRRSPGRFRLLVLSLAVALVGGFAVTTGTVTAAALPPCSIGDTLTKHRLYTDWNRSLLDTYFRLGKGYAPSDLKSTTKAGLNSGHKVRRLVLDDLRAMAKAARKAGARFAVHSAYRSYRTQVSTFNYWVRVDGYAVALKTSARAGHSEHQLGTTLDFRSPNGRDPWDYKDWAQTKPGRWLAKNAWKYGFVMSYPKGKKSRTCYAYEPWHYRYVGRPLAAKLRASGLTLREYLWAKQSKPAPPPTPTPAPSPTPTPTPAPSPTPTPEPTPTPTPTPEPTPTDDVADADNGGPSPSPTVEPTPAESEPPESAPPEN